MPKTFLLWLFLLAFISPAHAADPCKPKAGAALLQPKKGPTGAYEVGVGIAPHSLTKFNTKDATADIDFYFTVEYELAKPHPDAVNGLPKFRRV